MICHCNLREKVKVRLIQSKYIISKFFKERDSVVVSEVATEHEGSGFESIWVLLFLF
jgi:hypothetical protein